MPKHEKGTPKDLAIRMKARGLQKLKFYCQMCSKQCRDENGFKCHLTSDSHLRQMQIFSENASGMLDSFSTEFEKEYLDTLRRRHGTSRMNANNVYQEVIQNKHHVHMNATKWTTLGDFVQYLGKSSKCVVEETERGWYVTYIDRDPEKLKREEEYRKRLEREKLEEEREKKRLEKRRMEAAKAFDRVVDGAAGGRNVAEATSVLKGDAGENIGADVKISLGGAVASASSLKRKRGGVRKSVLDDGDDDDDDEENYDNNMNGKNMKKHQQDISHVDHSNNDIQTNDKKKARKSRWGDAPPTNNTTNTDAHNGKTENNNSDKQYNGDENKRDSYRENNKDDDEYYYSKEHKKKKKDKRKKRHDDDDNGSDNIRKENWIRRDILVRIISKKFKNGKYYKEKGVILKVIDKFTAQVELLDYQDKMVEIDQDDLETVIPKRVSEEEEVCILNGRGGRGSLATVLELDKRNYEGVLKLKESGKIIEGVKYEDFSKVI